MTAALETHMHRPRAADSCAESSTDAHEGSRHNRPLLCHPCSVTLALSPLLCHPCSPSGCGWPELGHATSTILQSLSIYGNNCLIASILLPAWPSQYNPPPHLPLLPLAYPSPQLTPYCFVIAGRGAHIPTPHRLCCPRHRVGEPGEPRSERSPSRG